MQKVGRTWQETDKDKKLGKIVIRGGGGGTNLAVAMVVVWNIK
jgi:hypothetical protein